MLRLGGHTIALGGVGGDAHSVGLTVLRQALQADGYRVHFLGPQSHLDEILRVAPLSDVVMISCMDGHTRHYLRQFPELVRAHRIHGPLWYLGGNLTVSDAFGYERYFRDMGFDRVFVKFTDLRTVLETLKADLVGRRPIPRSTSLMTAGPASLVGRANIPADDPLDAHRFTRERQRVLQQWKTGCGAADLDENAGFLATRPYFAHAEQLRNEGRAPILVQARSGVPLMEDQLALFRTLLGAGVPVLSYQIDSLTRANDYAGAEEGLRESRELGLHALNGFPLVVHGVPALRAASRGIPVPVQTRHSTRDPRLLAEMSYAGGITAFEGGPISYNLPYFRNYPLEEAIRRWQYVDHLTGLYGARYGITLDREFFGPLTGTLVPPSLAVSIGILETILAIQQGVRCVSIGYGEGGNRSQDIAAVRVLRSMTDDFLRNLGYAGVQLNTVFHQYMAGFPNDRRRAEELIVQSAVTATLSGATRVIVKTPAEALRIPTVEDHLRGIELVRCGNAAAENHPVDEAAVALESEILTGEVSSILDRVLQCGDGRIAKGLVVAFREGYLDIPFAPSVYNRGEVSTARDSEGAIRFLSVGRLPFGRELREFHRDRMGSRRRCTGGGSEDFLLVEHDVLQIPRGDYERWPLG